jgi:hypothetical protein
MKKILLCLVLVTSNFVISQTYSGPESVEYDQANSRWLVGNTSSHQILARATNGTLSVLATGLVSGPYGIEIVGDVVYCCSGASIKGYSLSNGTNVFNLNIGGSFLNGLTHDNSGNLYVTDFSAKKILKVNIAAQTFSTIASNLVQTPNGIVFDEANNRCVFVNWGSNAPIKAIDLTTNAVTTLVTTTLSNCDGISKDSSGNYLVSNWGLQSVVRFANNFVGAPTTVATGLSSPADIFVNTSNVLAIPNSGNNTVTFVDLNLNVNQNLVSNSIKIVPNPVDATSVIAFNLAETKSYSATLFDVSGKLVTSLFENKSVKNDTILLGNLGLVSGTYFLVLTSDSESEVLSVLVK